MTQLTTAIILADRMGEELSPLDQFYPPALLPIAGKSPLEFCLEALCELGIKKVALITARHTPLFKEQFPTGAHWGIELTYLSSKGEERPSNLLKRHQSLLAEEQLVVRGDTMMNTLTDGQIKASVEIDIAKDGWEAAVDALEWSSLQQSDLPTTGLIRELSELPRLINLVLSTELGQFTPRGILNNANNWLATPNFSPARANEHIGNLYIGREAMVHEKVNLGGDVIVENGCFIDKGATLKNAIVMPNSYVGQNVSVENAIVCGSLLIDLNKAVAQQIGDPALISPIDTSMSILSTTTGERLIAGALLISTFWFAYPLAWLSRSKGAGLVTQSEAISNRSSRKHPIPFEKLEFSSRIGWLTRWPQLLHVMDGDLKLFGSDIESLNQTHAMPNLPLSQGVFGTGDLFPSRELDPIEKELWGFELANENPGFWCLTARAFKSIFKSPKTTAQH